MPISKKAPNRFFLCPSFDVQEGPNFDPYYVVAIGHVESVKFFQGRGDISSPPTLIFWGRGGRKEANHDHYDFSQISVAGVV